MPALAFLMNLINSIQKKKITLIAENQKKIGVSFYKLKLFKFCFFVSRRDLWFIERRFMDDVRPHRGRSMNANSISINL